MSLYDEDLELLDEQIVAEAADRIIRPDGMSDTKFLLCLWDEQDIVAEKLFARLGSRA